MALHLFTRRAFALPHFELPPLEFEDDELLLDQAVAEPTPVHESPRPLPTAGELRESIERNLQGSDRPRFDASDELREALADLRRSLG